MQGKPEEDMHREVQGLSVSSFPVRFGDGLTVTALPTSLLEGRITLLYPFHTHVALPTGLMCGPSILSSSRLVVHALGASLEPHFGIACC
jgi:hypothetical protein